MRVRVKGILHDALGQRPQSEAPRPAASASLGNLSEMQTLGPTPDVLGWKLWVGPAVCVLTSVTSSVP